VDLEPSHLEECLLAVRRFSSLRLAVVGDLVVDEHVYGQTSRISREAPVLILKETKRLLAAGGAGNAFLNVKELGASAKLFGAVGADWEAKALVESFAGKGFEVDGIGLLPVLPYPSPYENLGRVTPYEPSAGHPSGSGRTGAYRSCRIRCASRGPLQGF